MAKETSFDQPPRGHVGLLVYDSVNDKWYAVLGDADGHLKVDVVTSGLPTGGATEAKQDIMITALQLIDDLRSALNSVGTDELDVVIDGQSADVEITQTAPADLVVAQHQYDGSAWRKSNLLLGYNDRWSERDSDLNASAGANYLTTATVPSGYVYILQLARALNNTSATTKIRIYVSDGTLTPMIRVEATPAAKEEVLWEGQVVLKEGDSVGASFDGCTAGDDLYLDIWGMKMKIDM